MVNKYVWGVHALISYLLISVVVLVIGVPLLIVLVVTPRAYMQKNKLVYGLLWALYRGIRLASLIPLQITRPKDPLPYPAIYVANHQSAADIILLGLLQGTRPHFWFYWDYFSSVPLFSLFVTRLGLGITQHDVRRDALTLLRGITLMKEGNCNTIIFPEGSRFTDGSVHDFQRGFALLARKAGVPVIPVYIENMGRVYPPHSFFIYPGKVIVTVGEPCMISPEESDEDFCARIHRWFENYRPV